MGFNINTLRPLEGAGRRLFIETYGCQMNVSDTETVVAIMQREGYVYTDRIDEADVILINTCSIRDNAEQRIWGRLAEMKRYRRERPGLVVGIIGCMAERLREKLVEGPHGVDVVQRVDGLGGAARQRLQHEGHGGVVIGHGRVDDHLILVDAVLVEGLGGTDTLADALGEHFMGFNIDELVLQRGRTGVEDEDVQ